MAITSNIVSAETMKSVLRGLPPTPKEFPVTEFSTFIANEATTSEFEMEGYKWIWTLYPSGKNQADVENKYVSLDLSIEDTSSLDPQWEVKVDVQLSLYNYTKKKYINIRDSGKGNRMIPFNKLETEWGFPKVIELKRFMDETNGFLLKDTCKFAVLITLTSKAKESADDIIATAERNEKRYSPPKGVVTENGTLRSVWKLRPAHFLFPVRSFSSIAKRGSVPHESRTFEAEGFKWRLSLYPNGNKIVDVKDHISLYLKIVETNSFASDWEVHATIKFFVYNHTTDDYLTVEDAESSAKHFNKRKDEWGLDRLIPSKVFKDVSNGYVKRDSSCAFGVEVIVVKQHYKPPSLPPPVIKLPDAGNTVTWTIEHFKDIAFSPNRSHYSQLFTMGDAEWYMVIYRTNSHLWKTKASPTVCLRFRRHTEQQIDFSNTKIQFVIKSQTSTSDNDIIKPIPDIYSSGVIIGGIDKLATLNESFLKEYAKDDVMIVQAIFSTQQFLDPAVSVTSSYIPAGSS